MAIVGASLGHDESVAASSAFNKSASAIRSNRSFRNQLHIGG
jgi:hypothetical protein